MTASYLPTARRYYLDDLFPGGIAQIPYLYPKSHNDLLNKISTKGLRKVDQSGRVYYEVEE